jgi:hypothetical protein
MLLRQRRLRRHPALARTPVRRQRGGQQQLQAVSRHVPNQRPPVVVAGREPVQIAHHDEGALCPRDGNVEAPRVCEEPDGARRLGRRPQQRLLLLQRLLCWRWQGMA